MKIGTHGKVSEQKALDPRLGPVASLARMAVLAAIYFATAKLALRFAIPPGNATPLWPPSGIALAAVLLLSYRVWPGIWLGATLVNATTGVSPATAVSIGIGNTLEALLGAYLLHRLVGYQSPFLRAKDVFIFGGLLGGSSCAVAATVGVTSLKFGGLMPWEAYAPNWLTWWMGDLAGVILVTPLVMTWWRDPRVTWDNGRLAEGLVLATLLPAVSLAIFGEWLVEGVPRALLYLVLPFLGWTAFRFGPRETATAVATVVGIAVWGTIRGGGPFQGGTLNESLLLLQSFASIVGVASLALAAGVAERQEIEASLRSARGDLERRVQERTADLTRANQAMQEQITERILMQEALRRSEECYRLVAETANDAIMTVDAQSRILFANAAAAKIFGYAVTEMLGQQITMLIPEKLRQRHLNGFSEYLATEERHFGWERIELPGRHKSGREILLEISLAEFRQSGERVFTGIFRDITERKQAEEALAQRTRQLEAVRAISEEITRELHLATLLQLIIRRAAELVGAAGGAIHLWDEWERLLTLGAWYGQGEWRRSVRLEVGSGVVGTVVLRRKGMVVADYRTSPFALPVMLEHAGITAVLAEPLLYHDRLLGVVGLDNEGSGRSFTEQDREVLSLFASQAAIAIENARLFEQVRSGRERLHALSRRLVEAQEAERRQVARELHDQIGQVLTGLTISLEMSTRLPPDQARDSLGEAQKLASDLMARVTDLSLDLRPAMLDDLGLLPALLWHIERYISQTRVAVDFKHSGLKGRRFGGDVETAVYRIVQEALTNVARHAGVGEVTVRLWAKEQMLHVHIEDQGVGFDSQAVLSASGTSGLSGIRERASLVRGHATIESVPGVGTRVIAKIPLGGRIERRWRPRGA